MKARQLLPWLAALVIILPACGTTNATTIAATSVPAATDLLIHGVSARSVVETAKRELTSDIAVVYLRTGESFTCGPAELTGSTMDPRLCLEPKTVVIPDASAETFSDTSPVFIRYLLALQIATPKAELRTSSACMAAYVVQKLPDFTPADQQVLETEVAKRNGKPIADATKTGVIYAQRNLSPMLCVANPSDPSSTARKTS